MRYKVGDKVRVRNDLESYCKYGTQVFVRGMNAYKGRDAEITEVFNTHYSISVDNEEWYWTDEMLEGLVEEELTAEEATRILGKICCENKCYNGCPIGKARGKMSCHFFRRDKPKEVIEILKQYKKDREKKEVEVEFAWYAVIKDEKGSIVHEERIKSPLGSNKEYLENNKEILAKYCSEHNGKFYELTERRCVVKE